MSGSKVNSYGSTNTSLTNIQTVLDGTRMGFNAISLTNYSTTSVPAIAAGSKVEVGGSIYQFSTEEAISTSNVTSTSDATWYIELVPSSSVISARFSTTTPAWRDDYNGYYTSTSSINRNIGSVIKSSSKYLDKRIDGLTESIFDYKNCIFINGIGSTTGQTNIDFPNGYTLYNSIILTCMIGSTGNAASYWGAKGPGTWNVLFSYNNNRIELYHDTYIPTYYKLLLLKIINVES